MAESREIYSDTVDVEPVTSASDSSEDLVIVKEEHIEQYQGELEPLTVDVSPPVPPPQFIVPLLPTPPVHRPPPHPWAGTRPAIPPLLPELVTGQRPGLPWSSESNRLPRRPQTPSKWQEAFHLYTLYVDTNNKARYSLQNGCITFYSAQRIYLSGLQDIRRQTAEGRLASCYLHNMLEYGKLHKYISPDIDS